MKELSRKLLVCRNKLKIVSYGRITRVEKSFVNREEPQEPPWGDEATAKQTSVRARAHWPLCSTTCGRALWRTRAH